jgi:hypothetical protein
MKDERAPEKELKGYIKRRKRRVGRRSGRWIDAVEKDATSMLKCKDWSASAKGRIDEDKVQVGL